MVFRRSLTLLKEGGPRIKSLHRGYKPTRRFRAEPAAEFIENKLGCNNPIFFTKKIPEPLAEDGNLDNIRVEFNSDEESTMTRSELAQVPVALIQPEAMGIPAPLQQYLEKTGIEKLTPTQAKLLRFMYASRDIAVCAPTGSGKTFGLCIGVMARLMREGPYSPFQTLFLAPSNELCWQIERWIRGMWYFPNDPFLVFAATSNLAPDAIAERLEHPDFTDSTDVRPVRAPSIVVGTPEVIYRYYAERKEVMIGDPATQQKNHDGERALASFPVFCNLDTFICDEVDACLPPNEPDAPGNLLIKELIGQFAYQAPLHIILNSATLAGPTVRHVKKFLRPNALETSAFRLFDSEMAEIRRDEELAGNQPRHIVIPDRIRHTFYCGHTLEAQLDCIRAALSETIQFESVLDSDEKRSRFRALVILPSSADTTGFQKLLHQQFNPSSVSGSSETEKGPEPTINVPNPSPLVCQTVEDLSREEDSFNLEVPMNSDYFLVCPQNAVRGLHFPLTHVFVLAQPSTMLEYVHWAGRVGRLGNLGECVVVMQRHNIRHMAQLCSTLGIPFKLQRKAFEPVVVPHGVVQERFMD
jgi:superfamily II DNA/RNA helicase